MEKLKGGLGDGKKPSDFDPSQFKKGLKVEKEHSPDPKTRSEIASDHLTEDPQYYTHLAEMERKAKEKRAMLHPYLQGVRAAKTAFQITDDDKSLGDTVTPFLGAIDPTPFRIGTGLASAAMAPEGERLRHGAGGMLGAYGGQMAGGLTGGIIGALLGAPAGALLGLSPKMFGGYPGPSLAGSAGSGAILGGILGLVPGSIYGGYKGTQLGRHLAGGEKKEEKKEDTAEKKDDKE